jgi:hypothetical protein
MGCGVPCPPGCHVHTCVGMSSCLYSPPCPRSFASNATVSISTDRPIAIKSSVSKRALLWVRSNAPEFLRSMADIQPNGDCHYRFWQRGGGWYLDSGSNGALDDDSIQNEVCQLVSESDMGVTCLTLSCFPIETTEEGSMRVQLVCPGTDTVALKGLPVTIDMDRTQAQHRLSSRDTPPHPGPFHTVLHHMPTRTLDDPAADRITLGQVHVTRYFPGVPGSV